MSTSLPEHFEDFAEARREGFLRVKELKDKGHKICGYFCQYTPAEIISAAGLYQVGLCGSSADRCGVYNNDAGVLCILRKCFRHAGFFPGDWHGKGNHDRYVFTDPYPLYTGGASGTGLWYIRCLYFCDHRLDTDAFI